nr:DNA helicase PIF1, ATP-dependent [Tanacetum cinerariifolium]
MDCFCNNVNESFIIELHGKRVRSCRNYNLLEANEVATLIVGDIGVGSDKRDIMVQSHEGHTYSPCMKDKKTCSKIFPQKNCQQTTIDEDGYPVYMRRDNGRMVTKSGTDLDNIVTDVVVDEEVYEIKEYYDCRYVSSYEVAWRIFQFDIHERTPPFERLPFHLPGDQSVYFDEGSCIEDIINNPLVNKTMFSEWMEANKIYDEAKELTYV